MEEVSRDCETFSEPATARMFLPPLSTFIEMLECRGVAASRFVGRQDLVAYKGWVLTLGSMITIPMVWSM